MHIMETRLQRNQHFNPKREPNADADADADAQLESFAVQWKDVYPQLVGDTIMSLTSICGGLSNSFVNLLDDDDVADGETKSWLASVTSLLTIFGTLMVGPLADKLGRKATLLGIDAISILSWTLIWMADKNRRYLLLIGVPLTGVVRGGIAAINVVFVTEITHKKYRSTMLSFTLVYLTFGILAAGLLGTLLPWRTVAALCLLFFIVVFLTAARYTVESPIWLANFKCDRDAAKRCLRKLIPNPRLFEREWMEMEKIGSIETKRRWSRGQGRCSISKTDIGARMVTKTRSAIACLTDASFYRPAGVLLVLLTLSQMSGVNFMIYFVVDAAAEIGHDLGRAYSKQIFVAVGTAKFALALLTTSLSTKFGRKTLLYVSAFATLICSVCVALCSAVSAAAATAATTATTLDCVAILAYVAYMSFGGFGIWLVPYTLIGELLPNRWRGSCGPFFVCFSYVVMSAGAKLFPRLLRNASVTHIFLCYALVSALTLTFVRFCVPETGGRALKDIENYFVSDGRASASANANAAADNHTGDHLPSIELTRNGK